MDDMYCWGGGELRGIMSPDATPDSVTTELLVFCKLAVKKAVVPPGWDWKAFLDKALGLVGYAFEKSDAKKKYGGENVFSAAMGGRSLRFTGEVIYGSSVTGYDGPAPDETDVYDAVEACMLFDDHGDEASYPGMEDGEEQASKEARRDICADVGGVQLWEGFEERLVQNPGPNMNRNYDAEGNYAPYEMYETYDDRDAELY
eukprot:1194518-Prorocentrum_minimum.AAC.3